MGFDDAFDELARLAYQTAYRVLGSRAEAEEIAQDTMIKAYVRWRTVQRHPRPWVCRVAVNGALGRLRRRGRHDPRHDIHPDGHTQAEVANRVDLQRLLTSLSRRQRDVIVLRYLADLSEADVAAELGVSVGTVKTHAHRGLEILRTQIDSATVGTSRDEQADLERKEPTDV